VLFISVACFWGMNTVAMRVAGHHVPPLTVATARAIAGGSMLLVIARARGADWPRHAAEWKGIAWIALYMTGLSTAFLFLAARNAPAGLVSIFSNTMPLFVAGFGIVLLSESVSGRSAVGLAVGLCGTVLVAWRAVEGDVRLVGVIYGLLGALTSALGSIMYKRHPLPRLDRLMLVALQLLVSSVVLGVMAVPEDRSDLSFPWQLIVSFVYLSMLGLAVSFVFWSELLGRGTGLQASAVAYLSTVAGVLFGALLLGERLSWTVLVGGVIAILGVAIVQSTPPKAPTVSDPA
jgi:drug/metabolite transporter (DMT)-like permease